MNEWRHEYGAGGGGHEHYGLLLPNSPGGQQGLWLPRKPLSRCSRSYSALMDAAADEGNAALTPFKRTLPSLLHLHLKGQFTQNHPRLSCGASRSGRVPLLRAQLFKYQRIVEQISGPKEGGHPSESLSQGHRLLPRDWVQRTCVNYCVLETDVTSS